MDVYQPWLCENGHVLGQMRETGRGIQQLLLYRHAVDMKAESPREVEIIGYLEGTMQKICCDVDGCGMVRTWKIGAKAAKKVARMYAAE